MEKHECDNCQDLGFFEKENIIGDIISVYCFCESGSRLKKKEWEEEKLHYLCTN